MQYIYVEEGTLQCKKKHEWRGFPKGLAFLADGIIFLQTKCERGSLGV